MLTQKKYWYLRMGISIIIVLVAITYSISDNLGAFTIDETALKILGVAVIIIIFPWEKLHSLKLGSLELAVDSPQVQNVLNKLDLDRIESTELRGFLESNSIAIQEISGSRILWIDDKPQYLVGQIRLLRALKIEVITAISTKEAIEKLVKNPDFDLIVTDIQRRGDSYNIINEQEDNDQDYYIDEEGLKWFEVHEGVNLIFNLYNDSKFDEMRKFVSKIMNIPENVIDESELCDLDDDAYFELKEELENDIENIEKSRKEDYRQWINIIRDIPVVFYSSYKQDKLIEYTQSIKRRIPKILFCNKFNTLVANAIERLQTIYSRKLTFPTKKTPTSF